MLILLSLLFFAPETKANTFCRQYEASSVWGKVFIQTESHYMVWDGEAISSDETRVWGAIEVSCSESVGARSVCGYWIWSLVSKPCEN